MRVWDAETGICHRQRVFQIPDKAFAISPDGNLLVVGEHQSVPKIFSVDNPYADPRLLGQHLSLCRTVTFSPDGTCILCVGDGYQTYIWDVMTGNLILDMEPLGKGVSIGPAAFSPDGLFVAFGCTDYVIRIVHIRTKQIVKSFFGHNSWICDIAFSPDGKQLVSGSEDTTVKIWDRETGCLLSDINGHRLEVNVVAFSPDGKLIASGSSDCSLRFWSTDTWQKMGGMEGFVQPVCSFCFSQDWSRLVVNTHNDHSVEDPCAFSVLDFDGPNIGSLSPEEAELFI